MKAKLGIREQDFILRFGHICRRSDLMELFGCSKRQIDQTKKALNLPCVSPDGKRVKKLHFKQVEFMFNNNSSEIATNVDFRSRKVGIPVNSCRVWSQLEEDYLLDYFGLKPTDEICRNLNRTRASVYYKARALYLKASDNVGKFSIYSAIRKFNLPSYTLLKAVKLKTMPTEKIGKFIYVSKEDLSSYIQKEYPQMKFFCAGCCTRHLTGTILCPLYP